MHFAALDWFVLAACVLLIFVPALFFARRASRSMSDFFASGRSAPWWLAGTSMVATTFATDTPGLVTQFVREQGIAQNWVWWSFLLTGMATVFFFARLWRRSGVLTDLEFYELRYAPGPAKWVRAFRAIYLGLIFNCIIMATVTLAAVKIAATVVGADRLSTIIVCGVLCLGVSAVSGLWGVLVSDLIQFGIAVTGAIVVAYFALSAPQVGGLDGLIASVDPSKLSVLPAFERANLPMALSAFVIPLTVLWWSTWYPGSEPGGGSYVAQRILASKNEGHALGATLWFNIAHYALRPWPWILVGLSSLLVFPHLEDLRQALPGVDAELIHHDIAYPAMMTLLPAGWLGFVAASLLAAYVSTMSTQLNWGASYLVNDFYVRYLSDNPSPRRCIAVSRFVTVMLMVGSGALVYVLKSAHDAFDVIVSVGAGTGLIYLLRWYWWRINAWAEIAAMGASFVISVGLLAANRYLADAGIDALPTWVASGLLHRSADNGVSFIQIPFHTKMCLTAGLSTLVWVLTIFATPPTPREKLIEFYRLVTPAGAGWGAVRTWASLPPSPDRLPSALASWVLACVMVYSALFAAGAIILKRGAVQVGVLIATFTVCIILLLVLMSRDYARRRSAEGVT